MGVSDTMDVTGMRQETELLIVDDNSNDGSQATVAALQSEVAPSSTLACLLLPAHAEAEKRVSCGIALMPQHSCPPISNLAYPSRVASIHLLLCLLTRGGKSRPLT